VIAAGVAGEGVHRRGDEAAEIEARVRPEVLVLDRRRRVDHLRRDLVVGHELAAMLPEGGELDRARSVEDRGRRIERQVVEGVLRIRQVAAVVGVGADRRDEPDRAQHEEAREEQQGDREGDAAHIAAAAASPCGAAASVALAPLEAGLHDRGDDTIGSVEAISPHRVPSRRPGA
jgi:hypothetical protein